MWTKEFLEETIRERMADYLLVVVSNRQPYSHVMKGGKLVCARQPGGVVTALDPVMQATKGIWIAGAHSPHDMKTVDQKGHVMVPPEHPAYCLRRVALTKEDVDAYYHGYSNEGLWPLCHMAYTRPQFQESDWQSYQQVNRKFAEAVLEEVGNQKAFVWIQDYHLTLVAKYLREAGCQNIITSLFWHVPWPNPEVLRICPQRREILEGLLSNDLLGFHIRYHCDNFLATVDREIESRIDREKMSVIYQQHETFVRPFPISVDYAGINKIASENGVRERGDHLLEEHNFEGRKLILSVDRIDYTKGIPDKFRAIDRFIEKYPQHKEQFVFLQLGQVSRIHVPRYKALNDELNALVEEINWKHSHEGWVPIVFMRKNLDYKDVIALYQLTDVCIVSSLHDGMNLVSKEFVASRIKSNGVLILSEFTGSSRELEDALVVNPYDSEGFADAIKMALTMPEEEREKHMTRMRQSVEVHNIYRWAGKVLSQLLTFEFQEV